MSDTTARTRLIGLYAEQIAELKAEVQRLEEGKRPRFSKTWERIAVLVVSGLIAIGQSWVNSRNREVIASDDVQATKVLAERDVARARADDLYDVAEGILIASSDQGCEVEVK